MNIGTITRVPDSSHRWYGWWEESDLARENCGGDCGIRGWACKISQYHRPVLYCKVRSRQERTRTPITCMRDRAAQLTSFPLPVHDTQARVLVGTRTPITCFLHVHIPISIDRMHALCARDISIELERTRTLWGHGSSGTKLEKPVGPMRIKE